MECSTWHSNTRFGQFGMLRAHYADDPNTLVASNLALYFTAGNPADMVAPDIFVSRGVPNHNRDSYNVWEEGKVPDFALVVSRERSYRYDLGPNMEVYARIGVPEYCVCDSMDGLHFPRLQMFRLAGGEAGGYERVKGTEDKDGSLAVPSDSLGLELRLEHDLLRLWDPAAQEYLLDYIGECAAWRNERAMRIEAEQRVARLELELETLYERLRRHRQRTGRKGPSKRVSSGGIGSTSSSGR